MVSTEATPVSNRGGKTTLLQRALGKVKKPRVNANGVMVVASVVLGAAAVYFARNFIEERVNLYKSQLDKEEAMIQVVVPNTPLAQGTVVTKEQLSLREVPASFTHGNALTGDSFASAVGQRLRTGIAPGKPLLWTHLEGGGGTFSDSLVEGNRALTVPVDTINSISGMLQPSDNIDLFLSQTRKGQKEIYPIMQNLHVLATGRHTEVDKSGQPTGRSYSTITVEVSPKDAKRLVLAQSVGRLTATLRNREDDSPIDDVVMRASELRGIKPRKYVPPPPPPRGIEFIIGGVGGG